MTAVDYKWPSGELTDEEVRLVREYAKSPQPLDALAYTKAFEELVLAAGFQNTLEDMHRAFITLLNLRKRGRLPRRIGAD